MGGKIVIILEADGKLSAASDFDPANTLMLLEKIKAQVVGGALQPQQQGILQARAVPRINGLLPGD